MLGPGFVGTEGTSGNGGGTRSMFSDMRAWVMQRKQLRDGGVVVCWRKLTSNSIPNGASSPRRQASAGDVLEEACMWTLQHRKYSHRRQMPWNG